MSSSFSILVPSENIEEDLLSCIPQFLDTSDVLVCGDFNVNLKTMGYTGDDDGAETLLEYIIPSQLSIMNNPDAMCTFVQDDSTGQRHPDLNKDADNILCSLYTWKGDAHNYRTRSIHRYKITP